MLVLGLLVGTIAANIGPRLWRPKSVDGIALGACIAVVCFGLHSLVDYFLAYTKILVVAWPILGLAVGPVPRQSDEERANDERVTDG